jgi:hypothetical protein
LGHRQIPNERGRSSANGTVGSDRQLPEALKDNARAPRSDRPDRRNPRTAAIIRNTKAIAQTSSLTRIIFHIQRKAPQQIEKYSTNTSGKRGRNNEDQI